MNEYIVYTTEGYTVGPNEDIELENCQMLGFSFGDSEADAIRKLFDQNELIREAGFTEDNAIARPLLPVNKKG